MADESPNGPKPDHAGDAFQYMAAGFQPGVARRVHFGGGRQQGKTYAQEQAAESVRRQFEAQGKPIYPDVEIKMKDWVHPNGHKADFIDFDVEEIMRLRAIQDLIAEAQRAMFEQMYDATDRQHTRKSAQTDFFRQPQPKVDPVRAAAIAQVRKIRALRDSTTFDGERAAAQAKMDGIIKYHELTEQEIA